MITKEEARKKLEQARVEYFVKGDLEGTLRSYSIVLDECSTNKAEPDALAIVHQDLADILYELGRKQESYQNYDEAIRLAQIQT